MLFRSIALLTHILDRDSSSRSTAEAEKCAIQFIYTPKENESQLGVRGRGRLHNAIRRDIAIAQKKIKNMKPENIEKILKIMIERRHEFVFRGILGAFKSQVNSNDLLCKRGTMCESRNGGREKPQKI